MDRTQYTELTCALILRDWQRLICLAEFGGRAVDSASELFEQPCTGAAIYAELICECEEVLGSHLGKG